MDGAIQLTKKLNYQRGTGISKVNLKQEEHNINKHEKIDHYKDIVYQCGKCGTCRTVYQDVNWARICPSGEFGKFEPYYLGGKNLLAWALTSGKLKWTDNLAKIFYHCSVCLACAQQCQIPEIHAYAGDWLMAMREEAVNQGYGPMTEHLKYTESIENENNPYNERNADRLNWLPSNVKISPDANLAYFVGCTSSYREQQIAISTTYILNSLDVDFRILNEECCCGSPVYMTGQASKAKKIAEANIKKFKAAGIEKIITSCAGCYRTLKELYTKNFGLNHEIEILHLPEFLLAKFKSGELKFNNTTDFKITYHDPCHIGRHMGMYEQPRELLQSIPGIELIEMPRNKHNAWCCGSGGGVRSAFKEMSAFAARERIEEAKETSAEALVSCCPFCLNQ
ncbi:MAG: (Fe-S)-binding protein, partial [Promethearchaeota archaeon]